MDMTVAQAEAVARKLLDHELPEIAAARRAAFEAEQSRLIGLLVREACLLPAPSLRQPLGHGVSHRALTIGGGLR